MQNMTTDLRVSMVNLGCCKNQVDGEIMLSKLQSAGYEIISDAGLADIVIINTCGFIEAAKEEAIDNILEFCTLKEEGRIKKVIITGCLAERYKDEVLTEIPEADAVIGIGKNEDIVEVVNRCMNGEKVTEFPDKTRLPLSGDRVLTNPPHFVYIKIAEGCSNNCTYCAIPLIRGPFRSRPKEEILKEVRYYSDRGVSEINIVAQDTTRYGEDFGDGTNLAGLLRDICKIESVKWVRILYAYPERLTDELISVIKTENKIVKYIDIPLQHADAGVLKRMNRHGSFDEYLSLVNKLRKEIPEIVLRTTLIAGFPGETDRQFETLCDFVKTARFDRLGCFPYSEEEGTPAEKLDGKVPKDVREERADIIMTEAETVMENAATDKIGKTYKVLLEGFDKYAEVFIGRTYMDAPDVDPKVFFTSENTNLTVGEFYDVTITDTEGLDLIGEIKRGN